MVSSGPKVACDSESGGPATPVASSTSCIEIKYWAKAASSAVPPMLSPQEAGGAKEPQARGVRRSKAPATERWVLDGVIDRLPLPYREGAFCERLVPPPGPPGSRPA